MSKQVLARALAITSVLVLGGTLAWSYAQHGIVYVLGSDDTPAKKVAGLRSFLGRFGAAAPVVYVGFVVVEVVVAPLPGTMLYAPGGVIFGGFWGGFLSLLGNVIGAGIACQLMRSLFGERAKAYLASSRLARYEERLGGGGAWVVFLLRVNPLTSSDIVSYAAGLTRLSVRQVMLGTFAGMLPLCFAQSYLADSLLTAFPQLFYPALAACGVYAVVVMWILAHLVLGAGAR